MRRTRWESPEAFRAIQTMLRRASAWRGIRRTTGRPSYAPVMECSMTIRRWHWHSTRPSPMAPVRRNLRGLEEHRRPAQVPQPRSRTLTRRIFFKACSAVCLRVSAIYRISSGSIRSFRIPYSQQANLSIERDLGHNFALDVAYNFNGGHHLNRPLDVNPPIYSALVSNWRAAMSDTSLTAADKADFATNPLLVDQFGVSPTLGPYVPAAVTNFFRRSGANPTYCGAATNGVTCTGGVIPSLQAQALVSAVETRYGLGLGLPIPFGGMSPNVSDGNSVYHGFTANLRKRFSDGWELLASYTWSHAIDDSTDLETPLSPQDNLHPNERSNSTFDQRHRFVWSSVYQSGRVNGNLQQIFSDWTVAPIVEISSGRPFAILTGSDTNFDFGSNTDRPNVVPAGTGVDSCGDAPVASKYSPTGFLQAACFIDGTVPGNLGRNAGTKPHTVFTDLRISRRLNLSETVKLDAILDTFNV